jgi:dTMP kinase
MGLIGKGIVVTFEGIDGSGKSTAIDLTVKKLEESGVKYMVIRDEGELPHLEEARDCLSLDGIDLSNPDVRFLLYIAQTASKEPLYRSGIEQGMVVLVDRGIDTLIAYGSLFTGERNESFYRGINRLVMTYFDKPDLTFLFNCSSEMRRERLIQRIERGEKEETIPEDFDLIERKLEAEYRSLVLSNPSRFRTLETTNLSAVEVAEQIWSSLVKELSRRKLLK